MLYLDAESRKEKIRGFIAKNTKTTFREIKEKLHIKVNQVYKGGMKEAFIDAGVRFPRTFRRLTPEDKKKILFDFIRKHPIAGGQTIRRETKINFLTLFKTTRELFEAAGVDYPRVLDNRSREEKKRAILDTLEKNPLITADEIKEQLSLSPFKYYKNFGEMYKQLGLSINSREKLNMKKRRDVIYFIKTHPFATQREINNICKTHVQLLFKKGIFDAYKEAGIKFPYERLQLHGTTLIKVKDRARRFEESIARKLSGYGLVNKLVKTERGFADIILERKGKKIVFEVKDYLVHEISISQVKQLNKYLEDTGCNTGILVCHKKPKKDRYLMGKNKIIILEDSELNRISELVD